MADQYLELLERLEERINTLEQILAHLFQGYVELATMVEGVIAQIITPLEPEAAQAFAENLTQHRRDMFAMVQEVANGMVQSEDAPADAVAPVDGIE